MAKREIVKVCVDGESHWDYASDCLASEIVQRGGDGATIKELADLCDLRAESINAHDYVKSHALLAVLTVRCLGEASAKTLMLAIAERGGLHGMVGMCGEEDSHAELNVPKSWAEWELVP